MKDGFQMKNCIVGRRIFQEDSSFTSNGSSPASWPKIVISPFHIHPFLLQLVLAFEMFGHYKPDIICVSTAKAYKLFTSDGDQLS